MIKAINVKKVSDAANDILWSRYRKKFSAGGEVPSWTFNIEGYDETFYLCNCEDLDRNEVDEIFECCELEISELPVCNKFELEIINNF